MTEQPSWVGFTAYSAGLFFMPVRDRARKEHRAGLEGDPLKSNIGLGEEICFLHARDLFPSRTYTHIEKGYEREKGRRKRKERSFS
jgi:hypothetical protein